MIFHGYVSHNQRVIDIAEYGWWPARTRPWSSAWKMRSLPRMKWRRRWRLRKKRRRRSTSSPRIIVTWIWTWICWRTNCWAGFLKGKFGRKMLVMRCWGDMGRWLVEAPVFVSIGAICCIAIQHNSAVQGLDQKDDDDDDDHGHGLCHVHPGRLKTWGPTDLETAYLGNI